MFRGIILTLTICCAAPHLFAEEMPTQSWRYHVIGSYSDVSNAMMEQVRLTKLLQTNVILQSVERHGVTRVLVNAESVTPEELQQHGMSSWLLILDASLEDESAYPLNSAERQPESETQQPESNNPAPTSDNNSQENVTQGPAATEPEEKPKEVDVDRHLENLPTDKLVEYPDFRDGESLGEYCARRAESRLCRHPKVVTTLEKEEKLKAYRASLKEWCNQLGDADARTICEEQLN